MASGGMHRRKGGAGTWNGDLGETAPKAVPKNKHEKGLSVSDVLRVVCGLLVLNTLLSYFITNDSIMWGWRPWFVRPGVLMRVFVSLVVSRDSDVESDAVAAWSDRHIGCRSGQVRRF